MAKTTKMHPEVKRFIDEVINDKDSHNALGKKNFKEIVEYGKQNGYELTDTELLNGLNKYYENQTLLPYWIEKRLGGLSIWAAWEERGG